MKPIRMFLLGMSFLGTTAAFAQSASQNVHSGNIHSGKIHYEGMQKIDQSQMRIVINGETVQPGSPNFPADLPEVRSFAQTLTFDSRLGKEERESGNVMVRVVSDGPPGGPERRQRTDLGRPFEELTYFDFASRQVIRMLGVKDGDKTNWYRSASAMSQAAGWQDTDKTKKIAGLTCRKATVPHKNETYTVWYTTDLPFTYSPIAALTPASGVILEIEGPRESFKATKIDTKADVSALKPAENAEAVSTEQLNDLRQKALADFRAKMMNEIERN